MKEGILTEEESRLFGYEELNTYALYSVKFGNIKRLFNTAREYYPDDQEKGLKELANVDYKNIDYIINYIMIKFLQEKHIRFSEIKNIKNIGQIQILNEICTNLHEQILHLDSITIPQRKSYLEEFEELFSQITPQNIYDINFINDLSTLVGELCDTETRQLMNKFRKNIEKLQQESETYSNISSNTIWRDRINNLIDEFIYEYRK